MNSTECEQKIINALNSAAQLTDFRDAVPALRGIDADLRSAKITDLSSAIIEPTKNCTEALLKKFGNRDSELTGLLLSIAGWVNNDLAQKISPNSTEAAVVGTLSALGSLGLYGMKLAEPLFFAIEAVIEVTDNHQLATLAGIARTMGQLRSGLRVPEGQGRQRAAGENMAELQTGLSYLAKTPEFEHLLTHRKALSVGKSETLALLS